MKLIISEKLLYILKEVYKINKIEGLKIFLNSYNNNDNIREKFANEFKINNYDINNKGNIIFKYYGEYRKVNDVDGFIYLLLNYANVKKYYGDDNPGLIFDDIELIKQTISFNKNLREFIINN